MQLHRLPRSQPHGAVAVDTGNLIEREPLLGAEHTAWNAHADHEGEGLLHLFARAFGTQVTVILQVHAVELHQLRIVLDDRAGDFLAQAFGQRAPQIVAGFLDALVARQLVGHWPSNGCRINRYPADSAFPAPVSPPLARPLRAKGLSRRHRHGPARHERPSPSFWHHRTRRSRPRPPTIGSGRRGVPTACAVRKPSPAYHVRRPRPYASANRP